MLKKKKKVSRRNCFYIMNHTGTGLHNSKQEAKGWERKIKVLGKQLLCCSFNTWPNSHSVKSEVRLCQICDMWSAWLTLANICFSFLLVTQSTSFPFKVGGLMSSDQVTCDISWSKHQRQGYESHAFWLGLILRWRVRLQMETVLSFRIAWW